jgi:phage-related protein
MTPVQQTVFDKLQTLSPDKQAEVLNFIESLSQLNKPEQSRQSLKGIWAGLTNISEEDIAEARRELWANFSSDDF